MKSKFSSERVVTPLLAILLISLVPALAEARIDLSVLQQQGYGVVEIKRPQPNTLAVEATINGHAAVLILETVVLGNVEMHQVPVSVTSIGGLHDAGVRHRISANGFLAAGFLRTCSAV